MKKNKLINGTKLLIVAVLLFFNSCSNEEYDEASNSSQTETQVTNGIEITEEIAREVALNFYNRSYRSGGNLLRTQTSRASSTDVILDFNDQPAMYAVNIEPNGFVLVTSNSKNVPIAGHSETGTFEFNENSPDGMKSWIAENIVFNDLLEARAPIEEVEDQWNALYRFPYPPDEEDGDGEGGGGGGDTGYTVRYSHTENEQTGPLMQTTWDQRRPYTYYTPNNYLTGCVAVATAQIMRYHEWPNTFNWSIMPNDPGYNSTSAGTLEIASLMADIGINVDMDYSASSSRAYSEDARDALVNDYGYASTASYSNYNFSTVKQEIERYNRPVYMRGSHSYETHGTWFWEYTTYHDGHAWVCDGYKQQYDVYIHNEGTQYEYTTQKNRYEWLYMNWGWRGRGNGWFYKNHIWIGEVLITLGNGNVVNPNFQYSRQCIYRIKP